ncbi:MAG: DUF6385 domain-containing protein [Syntrophomonas sp.]
MNHDSSTENNGIFNHDFRLPGPTGDFPAGWQRNREWKKGSVNWQTDQASCWILMTNSGGSVPSLCQQRLYSTPVYQGQVWSLGLKCRFEETLAVGVNVYFIRQSSRTIKNSLEFICEPGFEDYHGIVTVPTGASYAFVEVILQDLGVLTIEDVQFCRVFPVGEYDTDSRGRFKINTVESVKQVLEPLTVQRIIDPVYLRGPLETVRKSKDFYEDLQATEKLASSSVQDVMLLKVYSFCIINVGNHKAYIGLQISPDGVHWIDDQPAMAELSAGESRVLISTYYLKFIRVVFSAEAKNQTKLRIFFQGCS